MAYTFEFKPGEHTYNVGTMSDLSIYIDSISAYGVSDWLVTLYTGLGRFDLSRIFPGDCFVDTDNHKWMVIMVDNVNQQFAVTNSEYDSGTPYADGILRRWYTKLSDWYAARKGDLVTDTRSEICACYNDGEMTDAVEMNASTTSADYHFTITSPRGERHKWKAETGFKLNGGTLVVSGGIITNNDNYTIIEWIELIHWSANYVAICPSGGTRVGLVTRNCIIHNEMNNVHSYEEAFFEDYGMSFGWSIYNNIIYGCNSFILDMHGSGVKNLYNNALMGSAPMWLNTGGQVYNNITENSDIGDYTLGVGITPSGAHSVACTVAQAAFVDYANYDYRIKRSSYAYQVGLNCSSVFTNDMNDITRPASAAWDIGPFQAFGTVTTYSIGTNHRDYPTLAAWFAACPADLTAVGTTWKGEMYADSIFNEALYINGITTSGTYYVWLTAADKHNGSASGGGVVIDRGGALGTVIAKHASVSALITWLRITNYKADLNYGTAYAIFGDGVAVQNCIIHDAGVGGSGADASLGGIGGYGVYARNNLIYNINSQSSRPAYGIWADSPASMLDSNTVYNVTNAPGWWGHGSAFGIYYQNNNAPASIMNNISMASDDGDFAKPNYSGSSNMSNNLSSDATAPGASSQTSKTTSDVLFTNVSSKIFSLQDGSCAIGQGADLSASFTNDIIDATRTTPWTIGAFHKNAPNANWFLLQMKNEMAYPNNF